MGNVDREVIGAKVRKAREAQGLTQAGLAEAAEITDETVSRIERGIFEPSLSALAALAKALGLSLGELVMDEAPTRSRGPQSPTLQRLTRRIALLTPEGQAALLRVAELMIEAKAGKRTGG